MSLALTTFKEKWIENNINSLRFFRDFQTVVELCEDIKNLSEESCFELVKNKYNYHEYILDIIQIFCFYKIGKIKEHQQRILNLANRLLELKKYNRILELKKISEIFDIRDQSLSEVLDTVKLRTGDISSKSKNIDFKDVVNNSNIYFQNKELTEIFFNLKEVFNLLDFIKAVFTGIKTLYESKKASDYVIDIIKGSNNKKLIEVLNTHYKNECVVYKDLERTTNKDETIITKIILNTFSEDHLGDLCKMREELSNQDISREEIVITLRRMINKYEILGMFDKAKGLGLILKNVEKNKGDISFE